MSVSDFDFSLSSPRKGQSGRGKAGDKSITYDEEFEKFLNDTSESDLSTNRYKKASNLTSEKPWWMKEDEASNTNQAAPTKSFMKKPKLTEQASPKRLGTTLESDEFLDQSRGIPDLNLDTNTNNNSVSASIESRNIKRRSISFKDGNEGSQGGNQGGMAASQDLYEDEDIFDDETETSTVVTHSSPQQSRRMNSERLNSRSSLKSSHASERSNRLERNDESNNDESVSSSMKRNDSQQSRHSNLMKTNSNGEDQQATSKNLLSKVMFLDTLTSGELNKTGSTTLANNRTGKQVHINEGTHQQQKLGGTQTRRDLEDLEQVYRNFAAYNDSGLNTMIKSNVLSNTQSGEFGTELKSNRHSRNSANSMGSNGNANDVLDSSFGLQAVHVIKEELEKKALEEILKQLEGQQSNQDHHRTNTTEIDTAQGENSGRSKAISGWPPSKYRHIKGSGYGSSWNPSQQNRSQLLDQSLRANATTSRTRISSTSPRHNVQNATYTTAATSQNEINHQNYIIRLKSDMIEREEKHEQDVKNLRLDYEDQMNVLRAQIGHLTAELNKKTEQLECRIELHRDTDISGAITDEKLELLEKNNKEQEKLIKGYQQENERLYTEIRGLKDQAKAESTRLANEIKTLKFDLLQEKMAGEKNRDAGLVTKNDQIPMPVPNLANQLKDYENVKKVVFPTIEESLPALNTHAEYEAEMKFLHAKLDHLNKEVDRLTASNKELTGRNAFLTENQRQIDADVAVIRSKNKEIKRLTDKLKLLENGRTPVDCLRQQKVMKNQLAEMDLLVKRLRAGCRSGAADQGQEEVSREQAEAVCLSIDFYERKIRELEALLKEKVSDIDRLNRAWKQKFDIFKEVSLQTNRANESANNLAVCDVEFRLDEFESNYITKIEQMDNLVNTLRRLNKEFEQRFDEKQQELDTLKARSEEQMKQLKSELEATQADFNAFRSNEAQAGRSTKRAVYEPSEFKSSNDPDQCDPAELRRCRQELASMRLTLQEQSDKESDAEKGLKQMRQTYEAKLAELRRLHKNEVDKLAKVLTGPSGSYYQSSSSEDYFADVPAESPLCDPIRMRLMLSARDKNLGAMATVERQRELIGRLHGQCSELGVFKERALAMQELNVKLQAEIDGLRCELSEVKGLCNAPQLKNFEFLREKIKRMESNFARRETELRELIKTGDSGYAAWDSARSHTTLDTNVVEMRRYYEGQLDMKNKEILRFKSELDDMLQALGTL